MGIGTRYSYSLGMGDSRNCKDYAFSNEKDDNGTGICDVLSTGPEHSCKTCTASNTNWLYQCFPEKLADTFRCDAALPKDDCSVKIDFASGNQSCSELR
ncbi:hypothetical protein KQX54_017188 [Cotesia glomerata]|uniref:Uncharacterized protein n=1 Tax=Cotesia glomerata TaxID=32391 RepID=A0AAV7I7C3_COTGL|nr:hypothetical protein KQX54_017188 [Cotesia glomerata]